MVIANVKLTNVPSSLKDVEDATVKKPSNLRNPTQRGMKKLKFARADIDKEGYSHQTKDKEKGLLQEKWAAIGRRNTIRLPKPIFADPVENEKAWAAGNRMTKIKIKKIFFSCTPSDKCNTSDIAKCKHLKHFKDVNLELSVADADATGAERFVSGSVVSRTGGHFQVSEWIYIKDGCVKDSLQLELYQLKAGFGKAIAGKVGEKELVARFSLVELRTNRDAKPNTPQEKSKTDVLHYQYPKSKDFLVTVEFTIVQNFRKRSTVDQRVDIDEYNKAHKIALQRRMSKRIKSGELDVFDEHHSWNINYVVLEGLTLSVWQEKAHVEQGGKVPIFSDNMSESSECEVVPESEIGRAHCFRITTRNGTSFIFHAHSAVARKEWMEKFDN